MNKTTLIVMLLLALAASNSIAAKKTYTFGVVPQQTAATLAKTWIPFMTYIEQQSGIKLLFKTDRSIPEFEKKLAAGMYDLAYMNPYHYVVFHEQANYKAFAKAADKHIRGIVVIAKDSPIKSLNELHNSKVVFPAPAAFAASILPRSYLQSRGIDITPVYVNSHDSVYANVALGRYPAGGGVIRTFKNTLEKYRDKLKVLWTTKGYTPHAFAALSSIDDDDIKIIQGILLRMNKNDAGRNLLNNFKLKGFESATNSDWDDVRSLNINLLKK